MWKSRLVGAFMVAVVAPASAAAEIAPLRPEQITLENGDAAIRCAMLGQLAKGAGFFADVPDGDVIGARLNDRMLEIARGAAPEADDNELLMRMKAAFAGYDQLALDGDTLKKGEMMKADFQICLERAGELFGNDLLPDD